MKTAKDLMTKDVKSIDLTETLKNAAKSMEQNNCGFLLVGEVKNPKGVITDRDIVIRAIAKEKDVSNESVKDYISTEIEYCNDNDSLLEVLKKMKTTNVVRLIVKNKNQEVCGVISLGDIIRDYIDKSPNILQKFAEELESNP